MKDLQLQFWVYFNINWQGSAFPCFDDLKYPATFELILLHDEQFTCVSNIPVKNVVKLEDTKRLETYFAVSPDITTDTFAFILTKQDSVKVAVAEKVEGNMYFLLGVKVKFIPQELQSRKSTNIIKICLVKMTSFLKYILYQLLTYPHGLVVVMALL